jgi:lipoprotein-anchoring transpeptidase ErfK/SrfK
MVDYVPVLARAVAALDPNTSETRRILYDRARRVVIDTFRASDPTLSDTDLRAEIAAFEAAIRCVESDVERRVAALQPKPEHVTFDAPGPVEVHQDRPPLKDGRNPLRIVAGAFGVLVLLLAGAAAYSFWPRNQSSPQSVSRTAEQLPARTNYVYLRQAVYYRTTHPAGTLIVDRSQGFLYVVRPNLSALRYSIGVGPECTALAGLYQVVRKEEWPGWKPPPQQAANADYDQMKNPLGARALYLDKESRIHGTNLPANIRQPAVGGCIQLINDDIIYLYDRTPLESRVVVLN